MNILIAGGAGFIGTNLFLRWIKDNNITIIDNLSSSKEKYDLWNNYKNWTFINGDICKDIVQNKYDVIVNLACLASPKWYQSDPIATMDTCYIGTKNLLNLMDKNTIFLQASTSEIYGDPEISPQKEEYRGNTNCFGPRACYDEGKRIAETLCYEKLKLGYNVKIARIFNTYGPYMDPDDGRVITNMLNLVKLNKPITIYGNGFQTRSFQYIDDLLDGFELLINSSYNIPINLGTSNEVSIRELVETIKLVCGLDKNYPIIYKPLPEEDPKMRRPDMTLATLLGHNPKISLIEGIRKTYEKI